MQTKSGSVIKQEVLGRTNRLNSSDTTRTVQKTTRQEIILLLHVFVASGMCLPSRCLATVGCDTHIYAQTDARDL
jgi:hypothetical protein